MTGGSVKVDVGPYLIYLTERALSLLRGSRLSTSEEKGITDFIQRAVKRAATLQCIGMSHPVSLNSIYQPTQLVSRHDGTPLEAGDLLAAHSNAIIFAGPGRGKTTLLHWYYVSLMGGDSCYPLLFTLRRQNEIDELSYYSNLAMSGRLKRQLHGRKLLFLVDGYDEIPSSERARVSQILRDTSDSGSAQFFLTCRLFYDIIDLPAPRYEVIGFSREDAGRFAEAFASAYGATFNTGELINELEAFGFRDFLEHPLLLTLACILKSHLQPDLPRRTVALIRSALDVLRIKWDYEKGLRRETAYPLDGEDRLRCLMRVAFYTKDLEAPEQLVLNRTREYLGLSGVPYLDARGLLLEIAQWYGLFVPIEPAAWTFVHRTIQDYLAARFWVESGLFNPTKVTWNSRSAYAAALSHDATEALVAALGQAGKIHVVAEILNNNSLYDSGRVANAVLYYFEQHGGYQLEVLSSGIRAVVTHDFFDSMSNELLKSLCVAALQNLSNSALVVLAYALDELNLRPKDGVPDRLMARLVHSVGPDWAFEIRRRTTVSRKALTEIRTHPQEWGPDR